MTKRKFYAVRVGLEPGIYEDWESCQKQVSGFSKSQYKSFPTYAEAVKYMGINLISTNNPPSSSDKLSQDVQVKLEESCKNLPSQAKTIYECSNKRMKGVALYSAHKHEKELSPDKTYSESADERILSDNVPTSTDYTMIKEDDGQELIVFKSFQHLEKYLMREVGLNALEDQGLSLLKDPIDTEEGVKDAVGENSFKNQKSNCQSIFSLTSDPCEVIYQMEFDGASKGNPGRAGAGALLRSPDGLVVSEIKEGLGIATNNVAEYFALIFGLKEALSKNITCIRVLGDSKLVCMQMNNLWTTRHDAMILLHRIAQELRRKFSVFSIAHVLRGLNSDADALANAGVDLPELAVVQKIIQNVTRYKEAESEDAKKCIVDEILQELIADTKVKNDP